MNPEKIKLEIDFETAVLIYDLLYNLSEHHAAGQPLYKCTTPEHSIAGGFMDDLIEKIYAIKRPNGPGLKQMLENHSKKHSKSK